MHTYSVNTNERVNIISILAIISCFITPIFNNILNYIMEFVSKVQFINSLINQMELIGFDIRKFTILGVFWLLYELFDKKLWKWKFLKKD